MVHKRKVLLIIRLIFCSFYFILFFLNMSVSQSSLLYYLYFITFSSPVYIFFYYYSKRVFETLLFFSTLDVGWTRDKNLFLFLQFLCLFASCFIFLLFFSHIFHYSLPIFIHNIAYGLVKNFCLLFCATFFFLCNMYKTCIEYTYGYNTYGCCPLMER